MERVTALQDPNPYPGARAFTVDDRHRFFGRAAETQALAESWHGNRLTVLRGRAGAGKTSLLHAGVLALLRNAPGGPPPVGWLGPVGQLPRGATFPLAAFPGLNPYTFALLASWTLGQSPARARITPVADFVRRRQRTDWSGTPQPVLLAVDHAELWFHAADSALRLDCLTEVLDATVAVPQTRLLLVVREERADELLQAVKQHGGVPCAEFHLPDLDQERALETVVAPMRALGRVFAPGVAEALLDSVAVPGAVPEVDPMVLQVVCRNLALALPERIRVVTSEWMPNVDQALADHCATGVAAAARVHCTDPETVLEWLRHAASAREPVPPSPVAGAVTRMLADRQLIVASAHDGKLRYRLKHPRLAGPLWAATPRPPRPPGPDELAAEAKSALAEGDPGAARDLADRAARLGVDGRARITLDTFRGNVAYLSGRPEEAERRYKDAAELLQTLPKTDPAAVAWQLAAIGWSLFEQGAADRGVGLLRLAVARAPTDPTMQAGLGRMLWFAGRPDAAYTILSGVLNRDGDTPEALEARGEILADRGDAESALHDLDRVGPDVRPSTRAARALALAWLQHVDTARAELAEAVAEAADSGPVLYRAAQVERISGRSRAATEYANRAVRARHPPLPAHLEGEARRLSGGL